MTDEQLPILEPESAPGTMLSLLDRYVHDKTIEVEKVERLWAIYREEQASIALEEFNEALNAAQEEIEPVARTAENTATRSWYAKLEEVDKAIRPIYLKHGFSVSYNEIPAFTPGNVRIQCRCARGKHVELYSREAPPDVLGPRGSPTKTMLHGIGSADTFLKRYIVCGIFNVVFRDMDDDGIGGPIDDAQIAHIRELIQQVTVLDPKRNEETLCRYLKIHTLPELPQHDYRKATSALEEALTKLSARTSRPEGSAVAPARDDGTASPAGASQPSGRAKPGMRG